MKFWQRIINTIGNTFKRFMPKADFRGAEAGRLFWDWIVSPISADQEIKKDGRRLRARARDLAKNNPVIRQYLAQLAGNVIGHNGIKLQTQVRNNSGELNKNINDKIEAAWEDWGQTVSIDGRMTFIEFSQLVIKTIATDGEAFVRKVNGYPNKYGFALQLIDTDQVDIELNQPAGNGRNEIRLGVEVDAWGRPVAYWIFDKYPTEETTARNRVRVPAADIIHLYDSERVNQTRGVTWYNSVMLSLYMLDGYIETELIAARTASAKMGWLKWSDPSSFTMPDPNKTPQLKFEARPGVVEMLPPGLEFQEWSPDHPAQAFPDFVKTILRQIATGLRVSYNALANDLEGVNYSSMRSGLLIERDEWRRIQRWWIDKFQRQVFTEWLGTALLAGGLVLDSRDPRKFNSVKWTPRGWAWVDPEKDINASVTAIQNGLASRSEVLAERGADYEEVLEQLAEEKRLAEQAGVEFIGPAPQQPNQKQQQEQQTQANAQAAMDKIEGAMNRLTEAVRAEQRPPVVELRPNITVESKPLSLSLEVKTEKEDFTKVIHFRNNERGEIEAAEIIAVRA